MSRMHIASLFSDKKPGFFGSITALQTAEGAGPRSLEITGRIVF